MYRDIHWKVSVGMPALVISPAACQVVPAVSCFRSSRTTSRIPSSVRWKAMLVPIAPPPITTTWARSGSVARGAGWSDTRRLSSSVGSARMVRPRDAGA